MDGAFAGWAYRVVDPEAFGCPVEVAFRVADRVAYRDDQAEVLWWQFSELEYKLNIKYFSQPPSHLEAFEFPFPSVAWVAAGTSWSVADRPAEVEDHWVV